MHTRIDSDIHFPVPSWSVRCCQLENWCQRDCYLTDFVNDIGISFEHRTSDEDKVVFTGFFSEFDQSSSK